MIFFEEKQASTQGQGRCLKCQAATAKPDPASEPATHEPGRGARQTVAAHTQCRKVGIHLLDAFGILGAAAGEVLHCLLQVLHLQYRGDAVTHLDEVSAK